MEHSETWSNGPGFVYAPHSHPYHKTLICLKGSVEFKVWGKDGEKLVLLKAGDTLEIPPDTSHGAVVGPKGVTCTEVHRLGR